MLYLSWDMMRGRSNCHFSFWAIFCPFTPPPLTAQKMKIKKKTKKILGDIILHKCTNNHDLMPYCSWDIVHDVSNCYFSFWAIFCPNSPRNENSKKKKEKEKNPLADVFIYTSVPKIMIIYYTVPEIWHMTDVIIFHIGLFFALLVP